MAKSELILHFMILLLYFGGSGTKIALVATFTTPGIFNSNGKVGKKEIKKAVEDNINNFISEYNSFITSSKTMLVKNHFDEICQILQIPLQKIKINRDDLLYCSADMGSMFPISYILKERF